MAVYGGMGFPINTNDPANATGYNPLTGAGPGIQDATPYYDPNYSAPAGTTGSTGYAEPGATPTPTPTPAAPEEDPYLRDARLAREAEAKRVAEEKRLRSMNAVEALRGVMGSYGLDSLMAKIQGWVTDGYEYDAVMALIRTTPEYETRFPAMKALAGQGRAISEQEYIGYEQNAAELERLYGMPAGMLTSKDMITNLLTKNISGKELEQRTVKASANQYELPPEFRQMFQNYYNVGSGGLTAYFLDPDVAAPLLEKQFVSAQIGMEAAVRGIGADVNMAEFLYQQGVDRAKAKEGFGTVAGQTGFTVGKGEVATTGELVGSAFETSPNSINKVKRIGMGRTGKFEGGSGQQFDKSGVSSLGGSSR